MGWTTPMTWVAARLYASQLNTHLRDNLNFLYSPPGGEITHSGVQAFGTSGAWLDSAFDTDTDDPSNWHDPTTGAGVVVTVPNDSTVFGRILVTASGKFAANATGYRGIAILQGSTVKARITVPSIGAGADHELSISKILRFTATGTFKIQFFQSSGGSLNLQANPTCEWCWLGK